MTADPRDLGRRSHWSVFGFRSRDGVFGESVRRVQEENVFNNRTMISDWRRNSDKIEISVPDGMRCRGLRTIELCSAWSSIYLEVSEFCSIFSMRVKGSALSN